ncbi:MAG TPA: hypothetical protein VKU19_30355 [Bryobacteraceae bacterium]|nr:hypothetical protein [Bryobacteraceae bacterium]
MTDTNKKQWSRPQLTVLGDVETMTLQPKVKNFGGNDGFILENQGISG